MWYGLVSRQYAERKMMSISVAGGFIAADMPVDHPDDRWQTMFYAAIPDQIDPPRHGIAYEKAAFRDALISENSHQYLGTDQLFADRRGFARIERISNLLSVVDK